jgi:hypothetical protein
MNPPSRKISRRTALTILAATVPAIGTGIWATNYASVSPYRMKSWPKPVGPGYGLDPDLSAPAPWPNILTEQQRRTLAALVDIIIPPDDVSPGAAEAGVVDFIDEYVSAPYESLRYHSLSILNGIDWINTESQRRFGANFADTTERRRNALFKDIRGSYVPEGEPTTKRILSLTTPKPERQADTFLDSVHYLTITAFYMTDAGVKDIDYRGDIAQAGPYEGPSEEAKEHLRDTLDKLNLPYPDELKT